MTHRRRSTRLTAAALAVWMTALAALPASAAPISDGVVPTYDEAYYATLDYYGNLMEGSVVKSYALNGAGSITDYGVYDQVVNLTDATPAVTGGGTTAFQFDQAPSHFYFEGKTKKPFQELPWTISLRYTLNGVPVKAEELAGKTGVVEILLDIVPNEKASDYARYNYTLEAAAIFNQDDILSLEAPGAQVQLVGNLRTVLFMCLPGEEQHFTIRVGSDDFSFGGMTVLMVPATLAQLEEIAKLSQRKDDLEEDYRALSGSLDNLLDALSDIQGGLYASAKGLDQLEIARGTISGGKGLIYDGAGVLRGDLSNLADLLEPVEQRTQVLSQTIADSKSVLNGMADTALDLQQQLKDMENALAGLESGSGDLKDLLESAADMKDSLNSLASALGGGISTGGSSSSMTATVAQVKQVHAVYEYGQGGNSAAFITGMLQLSGKPGSAADVMKLQQIPTLEAFQALQAMGQTGSATEADWRSAQELKQLQLGVQGGMSFQSFCSNFVDSSTAKQMNDLWLVISGGGSGKEEGNPPETPDPSEPTDPSEPPDTPDPDVSEPETRDDTAPSDESSTETPEPAETPETPETPAQPEKPSENDSIGGAAVDLIAGGLDSANNKINEIQRELNSTLNRISRPTADVVRELASLCSQLDDLTDTLDDADDLASALRRSSQEIRSILDSADQLRVLLNGYEPTLQEAIANLGTLSTSAVTTIRDLERLLSDTEALMKTSGEQLDAGTKQSLKGLSAALRQTAKALAATQDVKDAKTTITDIIEDTWNEYTGDVNNILMMDAEAEAVSLTDSRNPAPSSVQVLIRTQEIKTEEAETEAAPVSTREATTFWGRIAQMFRDFWNAITGIFH